MCPVNPTSMTSSPPARIHTTGTTTSTRQCIWRGTVFPAVLVFILLLCSITSAAAGGRIAVLLGKGVKAHLSVLEGLRSTSGLEIAEYPLEENGGDELLQAIRNSKPHVIVALGIRASTLAKKSLQGFPLLFCLVLNPEKLGLIGETSFGISVEVSAKEQLALFSGLTPRPKRIGMIHNPDVSTIFLQDAQKAAQAKGFVLVDTRAKDIKDISTALDSLRGKIDGFWMTSDPVVANAEAFQAILLFTFKEKIPLIAPALPLVDKGALLAIGPDFVKIGRQAGDLAKKVIGGQSPRSLGLVPPEGVEIGINLKTANLIGLVIPKNIIAQAFRVVQ